MPSFWTGAARRREGDLSETTQGEETDMSETPQWKTPADRNEEILRGMMQQNGGQLEEDPAGRLQLVHDLRDLLQR